MDPWTHNKAIQKAVESYRIPSEVKEYLKSFRIKKTPPKRTVRVVAAVICDSLKAKSTIFATARGYGDYEGMWEFPGGKIEPGETPQQALEREIREELDSVIRIGDMAGRIEYDYPDFHLSMDCFWCEVVDGELKLLEAKEARWLTKDELYSVAWLPADITLIGMIGRKMGGEE